MSQLALHGRPWTVFDPQDRQHRSWYAEFARSGTWGRCPVRFVVQDDHGNLVSMIQQQLVEYYVKTEFKRKR
jgi:hypothetical protein